jgi:hypothetical protein
MIIVKGGGCTELVKMMGMIPPVVEVEVELEPELVVGRETPQISMAVVVTLRIYFR